MKPALLILLAASAAYAQTAPVPDTAGFDAVSVKPAKPARGMDGMPTIKATPGMVVVRNTSIKGAVAWAYRVTEPQVTGPDFLDSQRFDMIAKAAGPADESAMRLMMQAMLKDRFKLEFHRQNKEMQTYVLTIGKNGFKAKESKSEGEMAMEPNQAAMSVTISRAPISQLVNMLGQVVRAPVLDNTGLTGRYDLTLNIAKYAADMAERGKEMSMDPLALIVPILQEELGLKLESKKVALDLLVIDHVEKAPIEN
ncbi:MAG: TIGR03435 family protein [Candidatus Solibacter sp.]